MANERFIINLSINQIVTDILSQVATVEVASSPDEETMLGLLENTVGIVARSEGKITKKIIEAGSSLRVIGRPGAGYDSVDVAAATERKIPVVFAPIGGFAVAEGALALLLALIKKIPLFDPMVKNNRWSDRLGYMTKDMAENTLGIVGLGRIGSHLAKLAQPFGMTILGYDPVVEPDKAKEMGVEPVGFDQLLERSDYVSFHVLLNEETQGLINRDSIAQMKKGAILINASRGGVLESLDVLADALDSGQLQSVGLDVFPVEPPDVSHRIFKNPNCLCTPHVVGASEIAMERICRNMAQGMVAVLNGDKPEYCVNPEVF